MVGRSATHGGSKRKLTSVYGYRFERATRFLSLSLSFHLSPLLIFFFFLSLFFSSLFPFLSVFFSFASFPFVDESAHVTWRGELDRTRLRGLVKFELRENERRTVWPVIYHTDRGEYYFSRNIPTEFIFLILFASKIFQTFSAKWFTLRIYEICDLRFFLSRFKIKFNNTNFKIEDERIFTWLNISYDWFNLRKQYQPKEKKKINWFGSKNYLPFRDANDTVLRKCI